MLYVVTDCRRTYHGTVDDLERRGGQIIEMHPSDAYAVSGITSKKEIIRRLLSPRLLRLRGRWTAGDEVLVIGWYVLPTLALIRLGLLARPRKIVSMAIFVQSPAVRRAVNAWLRATQVPELECIVTSSGEHRHLVEGAGIAAERVHQLVWGGKLEPEVEVEPSARPYIFTGGYTNRDYETFFAAVEGMEHDVIAVASPLNKLGPSPANVKLLIDIPWAEFERLLAACSVLVLPLHPQGEISGASVVQRGMRYRLPIVATRHDALVDLLGSEYQGFVPAGDARAMRATIERAIGDAEFRRRLIADVAARRDLLAANRDITGDVLAVLQPAA